MASDPAGTVRLGTATDVEAVLAILHAADADRGNGSPNGADSGDRARRRLAEADAFFLVAEGPAGDLLGLAAGMSGRQDGGTGPVIRGLCHVSMVAVRPEHWGKGVGRRLVRALLTHGRDVGYERFQLFTHADNVRAQRLYEGVGFTLTGQIDVSGEGESIVHYRWVPGETA